MFWKDGLSEKIALVYDLSCIIREDDISFSWKYHLILYTVNERRSFSKNTWKYDIFFKCSEKMVFPKKSHGNMIFLVVLSGKMIFLFPENMILFFRRKMEDDLCHKNTWKYDIFFKCPEKMVFAIKIIWNMNFLGKMVFFFRKIWYIFFRRKMKDDLSQEIHGNMIFSVYMYKFYKHHIILLQKTKDDFSRKNTLKSDWHSRSHSRNSSNNSLFFYGDFHSRVHIAFQWTKIFSCIGLKFDFFNVFCWRYSTMKNLPLSPQELYLEVWLSAKETIIRPLGDGL